jgi:PAS domain S-box-containing protein
MRDPQVLWRHFPKTLLISLQRARTAFLEQLTDFQTLLVSLRTQQGWQVVWPASLPFLVYFVAYVIAQYAGAALAFALSPKVEGATPLYIQGAVTVSALVLAPPRRWGLYLLLTLPAILVDAWLLHLPPTAAVVWVIVVVYIIIVCISVLTVGLLRRYVDFPMRFASLNELTRFVACVAAGAVPAAFIATALRSFVFSWDFWLSWETGYLGYVLGIVVFTPAIVLWLTNGLRVLEVLARGRHTELALLTLIAMLVGLLVFGTRLPDVAIASALIYLLVPLLLWAAVRFGPLGFASTLALATAIAVLGAVSHRGPFVGASGAANVEALQLYLLFVGVPLFFLAALVQERKQADLALQASEERFRDVVEAQTELITRYLPDTTLTFVNEASCRNAGLSREQLLGTKFIDLLPEAAREPVLATVQALLAHPGVATLEHQMRAADGSLRWEQWVNRTIQDEQGHVTELQGIGRDITERKLMEREREEAREEAERQAEQLDRVFEAMADGVTVWDAESRLVRTNAALRRMLALDAAPPDYLQRPSDERMALYEPRDVQGHRLRAEDWPAARALRGEILTGSDAVDLHMRTFDGRDLVFTASAAPLLDHDGRVVGAVGILHDQTEQRQLEQEREEARAEVERRAEELDRMFEAMADGVAVFDQNGQHLRANAAYQRLLGLDSASVAAAYAQLPLRLRLGLLAIRDEQGRPLPPEEGPLARALAGEVLAGEQAMDLRIRTLDEREVELRVSAAPIRTPTGDLVGAVSIYRDVTESKQMERALAEQAEQLDRIVEGMGEGLFVYDTHGNVVRTNAAARRLLGLDAAPPEFSRFSAEERIALYAPHARQGSSLLSPQEWLAARAQQEGSSDEDVLRETESRDIHMCALDGREVEVSATIAPLHAPDGQLMGAVLLLSDRTERNQLAREREEARASELAVREVNQRLDTFVTIAAHDLRAPVAVSRVVVQRALQLLGQAAAGVRAGGGKQAQAVIRAAQALATTESNLDRLWRLVQQLLDVERVREGTFVLNRQPTDLAELVRTCVEEQRLLTPSRVIELDLPDPVDPADTSATSAPADTQSIIVEADADRIGQVVTNYLSNAERYSAEDHPITVTLRFADEEAPGGADAGAPGAQEECQTRKVARVEVRDQGVGIAAEDQATIWNRFQRATSVHKASGLGLGLYIAQTVVDLHSGQVGVESTLGQGSTFWFTLPLFVAPEPRSMDTSPGPSDDNSATPWP